MYSTSTWLICVIFLPGTFPAGPAQSHALPWKSDIDLALTWPGPSPPPHYKESHMHVEMRPIGSIRPYENNPRLNDAAVDAVAASIRESGFRQPIVVDEAGVIIVGHTRYKAALKLGLHQVPVHVAVGLTPAQAKAYRLADNQTAQLSGWDDEKLAQELGRLQEMDFDLGVTGFSAEDLTRLLNET